MATHDSAANLEAGIKDEIEDLESRLEEARNRLKPVQLDPQDEEPEQLTLSVPRGSPTSTAMKRN